MRMYEVRRSDADDHHPVVESVEFSEGLREAPSACEYQAESCIEKGDKQSINSLTYQQCEPVEA